MQAFPLLPFFQWLLKASLQGSLLIGLIFLVKLILRDRLPIRWYSTLWLLLLLRLALPWVPQSRISVFNFIPEQARPVRAASTENTRAVIAQPVHDPVGGQGLPVSTKPEPVPVARDTSVPFNPGGTSTPSRLEGSTKTLAWIWLMGTLGLGAFILLRNLSLWRVIKRERPVTDQAILDLLEDSKMQMQVQTLVGVIVTDSVRSPALFGFVRPRLLLPQGLIEALDLEELQHIFLHELAHLKRRDIHLGWLVSVLQVMHWFNPLVWLALCRMRTDQELACDGLVLSTMTKDEPAQYGQTIIKLFENCARGSYLPSLAGILEDGSQLERRIDMITNPSRKSRVQSVVAGLLLVALSCVVLTDAHPGHVAVDSLAQKVPVGLQENLRLYFSFDRDGGMRAVDISGMDFHGELHGCDYTTEGRAGGAMRFDGDDDYISAPNIKLHAFTFAAWVKTNTESMNNRRLFLLESDEQYYAVQGTSRGDVELSGGDFADDDPEPISRREFSVNAWTHVCATYDGAAFSVYKNGVLARSGRAARDSLTGTAYLGGTEKYRGRYWHGLMDEVALFNRALTAQEVQQLHSMADGVAGPSFDTLSTIDAGAQDVARFVGTWTGLAVDKPADGTSRDRLAIELIVDESGRLNGNAFGEFVNDGQCRLRNVMVHGNQISFEVSYRFQGMPMAVRLELKDGKLQGEGVPDDPNGDRCDIVLQRQSPTGPRPIGPEARKAGLVLRYSFNRDLGPTVTDDSGQGRNAKVYGARHEPNGRVGAAMSFDGDDDYISAPVISLREFTFAAWVMPHTGAVNNRRIFLLSDGQRCYALQGNVGSSIGIYVADGVEVNEYDWSFQPDQWTHVTVTHTGSVFKIYRDGRRTDMGYVGTEGVTGTLFIGGTDKHWGRFWQGMIDEVFIFNYALSDSEVEQLYRKAPKSKQVRPSGRIGRPRVATSAPVSKSSFQGVWTGMAVDKPGEGNTSDTLGLELKMDESGRLAGKAFGGFVRNDLAELKSLRTRLDRKGSPIGIVFEVAHRIEGLRMRVSLVLRDGVLKGEALPIDFEEDSCDILLRRKPSQ